jgi:hypothetical protein
MALPQGADGGEDLQISVNILYKQSGAADKGWSFSLGFGRGSNNSSHRKRISLLINVTKSFRLGRIL